MSLKQPVQYPVKYYSHADTDAPQLADADGVIKTILKECLVTGYGTKESAGWTALFEDDFRIVLRRPLQTGNPPDIKIENGIINGAASHRIVSQDNPTGLDDAAELAAVNLLARDDRAGNEWHLIVSDFAFLLCYQIGQRDYTNQKNNMLFCGSMQAVSNTQTEDFIVSYYKSVGVNGKAGSSLPGILYNTTSGYAHNFKKMRSGSIIEDKHLLEIPEQELLVTGDYVAQQPIVGRQLMLPFFCSVYINYADNVTSNVNIDGRPMLRYVNEAYRSYLPLPLYIPLDYWEL